jgi:NAD(P)-dependent dehydrogenase (short-subunit alcohol dehydrogenase family)
MATQIFGKTVLITGGGSGLGKSLCLQLGREGAHVIVSDIDDETAQSTTREIVDHQGRSETLHLDVTDGESIQAAVKYIEGLGGLDILINNAGIASSGTLENSSEEQWRKIIEINVMSVVNMTRAFLPLLKAAKQAAIVNIASAAGLTQFPGMASYNVTKAAVIALSETLRNEMFGTSVHVVLVCPSFFKTNLLNASLDMTDDEQEYVGKVMSNSRIQVEDVVKAIIRGIRKSRFLILPHRETRFPYYLKSVHPGVYPRFVSLVTKTFGMKDKSNT